MEEELQKKQAIQRKEDGKTDHLGNTSEGGASLKPPPSPFSWLRKLFGGGSQNTDDNQVENTNQVEETPKESTTSGNIDKYQTDKPYGWKYGYDFTVGADSCNINMKVNFDAQDGVSKADVARVQKETQSAVAKYYNKKHKLTDKATGKAVPVSFTVQFVEKNEHLKVKLHPGDGRDNLSNWYVNSKPIVRAHEMGHQLGLKDEYVDANAPSRATATSPGIFKDNSLMGNFWAEGVDKAGLKGRHTNMLADDMSSASGKKYTMK